MNLKDAHMDARVLEQKVNRCDEYEDCVKDLHMVQLFAAAQNASISSILPAERKEFFL